MGEQDGDEECEEDTEEHLQGLVLQQPCTQHQTVEDRHVQHVDGHGVPAHTLTHQAPPHTNRGQFYSCESNSRNSRYWSGVIQSVVHFNFIDDVITTS